MIKKQTTMRMLKRDCKNSRREWTREVMTLMEGRASKRKERVVKETTRKKTMQIGLRQNASEATQKMT